MRALITCSLPLLFLSHAAWAADTLQQARDLLAGKHFREAAALLEPAVQATPADSQAWLLLGEARRGLGQLDAAAQAYRRAHGDPASAVRAEVELFTLYAGAGRRDEAYPWFDALRRSHARDLSSLSARAETAALRGDARFALLFPDQLDYAKPFVQPVRIIHEWHGEKAGDEFGWIARGIGDADGDGVTDVAVSATANPPYGDGHGHLYLYSGKSGRLLWKVDGKEGALLGTGLEAAGDVDGDRIPDVAAGAPGERTVYVYSGKDGRPLWHFTGDPLDHDLGTAVAGIGDFDGDGVPDVAAGAPGSETHARGTAAGRAYVLSGRDGKPLQVLDGEQPGDGFGSIVGGDQGLLLVGAGGAGPQRHGRVYVYRKGAGSARFVEDADGTGAALGYMFVSVPGDVDGDGVADLYGADFSNTARGRSTGRAYIWSGSDGRLLRTLTGDGPGDGFGIGAARAGDVDRDGHADLVVGSWQYAGAAWSGGRVQVFSGKDGHVLQDIVGKVPGDTFGFDAVGVGDVDGDGRVDFLVTSAWSGVKGLRSGRAYIVAGTAGGG